METVAEKLRAKADNIDIGPLGQPVLSGIYPQLTPYNEDGTINPDLVKEEEEPQPVNRKSGGRKYRYSDKYKKRVLLDEFDEPYFAHERDDNCFNVSVSLPQSLNEELEKRIERIKSHPNINKRKEKLTKSRYIRQLIEKDLKVEYRIRA
jgi:hypothetical protein